MAWGGFQAGTALLTTDVGGGGQNVPYVHTNILSPLAAPIAALMGIALLGYLVGGIVLASGWMRARRKSKGSEGAVRLGPPDARSRRRCARSPRRHPPPSPPRRRSRRRQGRRRSEESPRRRGPPRVAPRGAPMSLESHEPERRDARAEALPSRTDAGSRV